jgi:hypothetical protein
MRWAGHVARVGKKIHGFGGKPEENRSLGNLVIDGSIILRWIFKT